MRTCKTCGDKLKRGYYHKHAPGAWEIFDPRDGRPVAYAAGGRAAARKAKTGTGLDYAQAGEGW
ncbi:MAG: hypothetical protein ACRDZ4_10840 [Egibacteraceae bacterium]